VKAYDTKVDVWSVGVIMGELLLRKHLFPGLSKDYADQLTKIFNMLGAPAEDIFLPGGSLHMRHAKGDSLVGYTQKWRDAKLGTPPALPGLLVSTAEDSKALLMQLLQLDPKDRITADQALAHPWFTANPQIQAYIQSEIQAQDASSVSTGIGTSTSYADAVLRIEECAPLWSAQAQAAMLALLPPCDAGDGAGEAADGRTKGPGAQ
jgi:serine/threonine protein kinase